MSKWVLTKAGFFVFVLLVGYCQSLFGQNTLKAIVKDSQSKEALVAANVVIKGTTNGTSTDATGLATLNSIPNGKQTIVFSYIGYLPQERELIFPLNQDTLLVLLTADKESLEEVVVTSTRSSRNIADEPTRIEMIVAEELDEKANMYPANISMLLKESTGIQVQQTSATSANANFRIQGLDGRYTQLLQNGFPLYSGFSGGLSLMQIPPLDLKQVEIIKSSSSTLYGAGAIAGIINLITKEPTEEREASFMLNATSAKGLDLNAHYGQKFKNIGITLYATTNTQLAYDPNEDGFSDIPQIQRYNFNPRFFYYITPKTTVSLGLSATMEDRLGGDMQVIEGNTEPTHVYSERNASNRLASQLKFVHTFKNNSVVTLKNSFNYFFRKITLPDYQFEGNQKASFSELNVFLPKEKFDWIAGLNLWTDQFKEKPVDNSVLRNYTLNTFGAFFQNTWRASKKFTLEAGLRTDYQNKYGYFVLPRISALFKITEQISTRVGGGLGYKSPTIFTQESEEYSFRNILPINVATAKPERSKGVNFDVNYKTLLFEALSLSLNQMFFYTKLHNPLLLVADNNRYLFENTNGYVDTKGFETNLKLTYKDFIYFIGYANVNTNRAYNNLNNQIPLTPRHRILMTLMYEVEGKWRIGYEGQYTGRQMLSNGSLTRAYFIQGFMTERRWKYFSLYINFENFTDVRISRWQAMYTGSIQNPQFENQLYAPTDGRIINGGVKIML